MAGSRRRDRWITSDFPCSLRLDTHKTRSAGEQRGEMNAMEERERGEMRGKETDRRAWRINKRSDIQTSHRKLTAIAYRPESCFSIQIPLKRETATNHLEAWAHAVTTP